MTYKIKLYEATTFKDRLLGLCFKKNINYALVFPRCNSIHTFFMKEEIDVVMTDKNKRILYIKKNMKKNRIILPKRKVYYTYEFPHDFIKDSNLGDILKVRE